MSDSTFAHYARELHFIRELMEEFGARYPGAKARLLFSGSQSTDPHVERILQSFALLTGRAHRRISDEFPEVSTAILGTLYPHYLAPVPSMGVVQFKLDPSGNPFPQGFHIPRGSQLRSNAVDALRCRFRTVYPVTLWPIELVEAQFQPPPFPQSWRTPTNTAAVLRLKFKCLGEMTVSDLEIESYRLHLVGDSILLPHLYELLLNNTSQVVFRPVETQTRIRPVTLAPARCVFPVGFDPEEGLLPYPPWCQSSYKLLTEFFIYPDKFFFLDIHGWKEARRAGFGSEFEIDFFLDRTITELEQTVDVSMFAESCTPIVNLFEHTVERISLDSAQAEYNLIPDSTNPRGFEIYSVESVSCTDPNTETRFGVPPYASVRHGSLSEQTSGYWEAVRYPSRKEEDNGANMLLKFVDLYAQQSVPPGKTIHVDTICTNRDLPLRLSSQQRQIQWELEAAAPLSKIRTVRPLTPPLRLGERRGRLWHLISHLLLNYLSLEGSAESLRTLKEILQLYDISNPELGQLEMGTMHRHLIEGIVSLQTKRIVGRLGTHNNNFVRGLEIAVTLDENKYEGTGAFLFASILEHFFPSYVSANSFSQLVAKSTVEGGLFRRWTPRRGELALV